MPNTRTYHFVKDGQEVEVHNLARFCRENCLSEKYMREVACGLRRMHHGWTRANRNTPTLASTPTL